MKATRWDVWTLSRDRILHGQLSNYFAFHGHALPPSDDLPWCGGRLEISAFSWMSASCSFRHNFIKEDHLLARNTMKGNSSSSAAPGQLNLDDRGVPCRAEVDSLDSLLLLALTGQSSVQQTISPQEQRARLASILEQALDIVSVTDFDDEPSNGQPLRAQ